jgi:hypothetical protein
MSGNVHVSSRVIPGIPVKGLPSHHTESANDQVEESADAKRSFGKPVPH